MEVAWFPLPTDQMGDAFEEWGAFGTGPFLISSSGRPLALRRRASDPFVGCWHLGNVLERSRRFAEELSMLAAELGRDHHGARHVLSEFSTVLNSLDLC